METEEPIKMPENRLRNYRKMVTELSEDDRSWLLGEFNDYDPNDKDFRIPPLLFDKIKRIVQDPNIRRYSTVDEFLTDSLELFTTWWTTPEKTPEMTISMWKDMTLAMKETIKTNAPEFYAQMEGAAGQQDKKGIGELGHGSTLQAANGKIQPGKLVVNVKSYPKVIKKSRPLVHTQTKLQSEITEMFNNWPDSVEGQLKYDGYPLIWSFYTRLFPAKIALISLVGMYHEQYEREEKPHPFVDYKEFQAKAYEFAEYVSEALRDYEIVNKIPRNRRLSTGLPFTMQSHRFEFANQDEEYAHRKKVEVSKKRFLNQVLGHEIKNSFGGLLNATGLAIFRKEGKNIEISLTEKGLDFCLLRNPIIYPMKDQLNLLDSFADGNTPRGDVPGTFSIDEQGFILTEIIPKFPLECLLVNDIGKIFQKLTKGTVFAPIIDSRIDKIISQWCKIRADEAGMYRINPIIDSKLILQTRIATMGRLMELGFVEWRITGGVSVYKPGANFKSMYEALKQSSKQQLPEDLFSLIK